MYHVSKVCERLSGIAAKCDLPPSFAARLSSILEFLKSQSLCDLDRRRPRKEIAQAMLTMNGMIAKTTLDQQFRENVEEWRALEKFAQVPISVPEVVSRTHSRPMSKYENKTPAEIMHMLHNESKKLKILTPVEKDLLEVGTLLLAMMFEKPKSQTLGVDFQYVWKKIQPLLRKQGCLDDLDLDRNAKGRVTNAIQGKSVLSPIK